MKPKMMVKMGADLVMTILLLVQMAYMLVGERSHEWTGAAMFLLFILHHGLNWRWYPRLGKGRYTPLRVIQTIVNFLVLASMAGLMVSGIILSREVFAFLPISGGMGFARILHMISAYCGFILMSIHLGLHWGMIMGMARKLRGGRPLPKSWRWAFRAAAAAVSLYGIYAFMKHRIADYLFVHSQFVFFDMEQPLWQFFGEYLAMMGLWVCLAYYAARALRGRSGR